ncbi:hypothetical protein EVAR_64950_1 [Eumeta japonica]|uniref:Uncharacterized protein n=1 Tax=Eumeta variegata TaxID=151549 RepID=A0A4C1Z922_EUMVA|nr:hypothetical protein EVAR_64950_1 [Eumeta japonica]
MRLISSRTSRQSHPPGFVVKEQIQCQLCVLHVAAKVTQPAVRPARARESEWGKSASHGAAPALIVFPTTLTLPGPRGLCVSAPLPIICIGSAVTDPA